MAQVLGDVCFPAGKYIKDGEEKTRWMKVGVCLQTDKGIRIKLDAIPVVTDENGLWMSVFERDDNPRQSAAPQQKPAPAPAQAPLEGGDVPF